MFSNFSLREVSIRLVFQDHKTYILEGRWIAQNWELSRSLLVHYDIECVEIHEWYSRRKCYAPTKSYGAGDRTNTLAGNPFRYARLYLHVITC